MKSSEVESGSGSIVIVHEGAINFQESSRDCRIDVFDESLPRILRAVDVGEVNSEVMRV